MVIKNPNIPPSECSAVILAGGANSRFLGKEKALIKINEESIIQRIYDVLRGLFKEVILVTNNPFPYLKWDVTIVSDLFSVRSSLTGIHAGLFYSKSPYAFIVACDTPFLNKELVKAIVNSIDPYALIFIPETSSGFEPLCAVYSKKCLPAIKRNLLQNQFKIERVFKKKHFKKLSENLLRSKDPKLLSFFNVNTPEDLKKAKKIIGSEQIFYPEDDGPKTKRSLNKF